MVQSVFFSYARQDRMLRDRLEDHLSSLKYRGLISTWYAEDINAGEEIIQQIDIHLNTAHIILLLISASFLASQHCYDQLLLALQRHEQGEAKVIPVLLRPVLITDAPFAKLTFLPSNKKAVVDWRNRDRAFFDIALGIERIIEGRSLSLEAGDPLVGGALVGASIETILIPIPAIGTILGATTGSLLATFFGGLVIKWRQEENRAALTAFEQGQQNATAYQGRGNILVQLGRYEEALTVYKQAVALLPLPSTYVRMGEVLTTLGRYDEAVVVCKQALALNASYLPAYYEIRQVFTKLGRTQEAEQSSETLRQLQREGWEQFYYQQALGVYEQALRQDSTDAIAYRGKGNTLAGLKRYEEALTAYEQSVAASPFPLTYVRMGETLMTFKRYNQAVAAYKQALALDPSYSSAYIEMSKAFFQLGKTQEAEQSREQARLLGDDDYDNSDNLLGEIDEE